MEDVVSTCEQLAQAFRGKRVLVTGNTGFKGSWLAAWLTRMGAEVTGFSDAIPTEPSHFKLLGSDYRTVFGDIADTEAVAGLLAAARPEIVFHLAAQSLVRRSYADPVGTYRTNVLGSLILFEACRKQSGVEAIVSATTDKVYRNREWEWAYRENDELGGTDPYSASKSCVELMTRSWRESVGGGSGIKVASVRAGNVIGGGDWAEDRLIPDVVKSAFGGEVLRIRNPAATRPWQHVLDPLRGYLMVGARLLAGDEPDEWNFGPMSTQRISVGEVVTALQRRLPRLQVEHEQEHAGRHESGLLQLDSAKAAAHLGWRPVWESEMLERTFEWYEAFYDDKRIVTDEQLSAFCRAADAGA